MRTIKELILDIASNIVRFSRRNQTHLGIIYKITKIVVFFTLLVTAVQMFMLENLIVGVTIMSLALFYLIMTKLDSMV